MTSGFGHYGWIGIVIVVAVVALLLYRRGRRLIGHQRFNQKRMIVRAVIFAAVSVFLLVSYSRRADPAVEYLSVAVGFVAGLALALVALRFTQMGRDERGVWYVPNLYLGLGLIALLVARFVYEYIAILPQARKQMEAAEQAAQQAHASNLHTITFAPHPVFHGVLFLVLGYYVVYYLGLLVRARREGHLAPGTGEADDASR